MKRWHVMAVCVGIGFSVSGGGCDSGVDGSEHAPQGLSATGCSLDGVREKLQGVTSAAEEVDAFVYINAMCRP